MKKPASKLLVVAMLAMSAHGASVLAAEVTSAVITGGGITNGNFTVNNVQTGAVEIGLRARVRFDAANLPTNNNAQTAPATYTVPVGQPSPGYGFQPNSASTAKWNFDWSINSDPTGGNTAVNAFTYLLSIDFDPSLGTNFQSFDPVNLAFSDNSFGNNGTGMGGGAEAANAADYTALVGANNLVQNSWNYQFFDSALFPFNANTNGNYVIRLAAFNGDQRISASEINVIVGTNAVPEPGSLALLGLGLSGLLLARRRKA